MSRIREAPPVPEIIDAHQDMSGTAVNTGKNHLQRNSTLSRLVVPGTGREQANATDIPRLIEGGYKVVFGAAFVAPIHSGDFQAPLPDRFLDEYAPHDAVYDLLLRTSDVLTHVRTSDDLTTAINNPGNIGLVKSVEGLYVNGDNWQRIIDNLHGRGVRSVGLTWNFNTEVAAAGGNNGTSDDTGLTNLGREVVNYLDSRDMFVDLSHASDNTIEDVLEMNLHHPAIATHSASRAVVDHKRNLPDELALEIAARGGFIGMPFVGSFIGGDKRVEDVITHLEHFRNLGILNAIGIGSDFDGQYSNNVVKELEEAPVVGRNLNRAMWEAGFTETEIEAVFNANALRYLMQNLPKSPSVSATDTVPTASR